MRLRPSGSYPRSDVIGSVQFSCASHYTLFVALIRVLIIVFYPFKFIICADIRRKTKFGHSYSCDTYFIHYCTGKDQSKSIIGNAYGLTTVGDDDITEKKKLLTILS